MLSISLSCRFLYRYAMIFTVQTFNACTSRLDAYQFLVIIHILMDNMTKQYAKPTNDPRSLRTNGTFSFGVRDQWLHLSSENWEAIGCAVVYYARAAHAFSEGTTCQHCMCIHVRDHSENIFTKHKHLPSFEGNVIHLDPA